MSVILLPEAEILRVNEKKKISPNNKIIGIQIHLDTLFDSKNKKKIK
jgi:hypothetical protein